MFYKVKVYILYSKVLPAIHTKFFFLSVYTCDCFVCKSPGGGILSGIESIPKNFTRAWLLRHFVQALVQPITMLNPMHGQFMSTIYMWSFHFSCYIEKIKYSLALTFPGILWISLLESDNNVLSVHALKFRITTIGRVGWLFEQEINVSKLSICDNKTEKKQSEHHINKTWNWHFRHCGSMRHGYKRWSGPLLLGKPVCRTRCSCTNHCYIKK